MHVGTWDQSIVDESILEFGSFEKDSEADQNGIYWMKVNSQYHWQVQLLSAKADDTEMRISANNIFFDTGASLNYIPPLEHESFMNELKKRKTCDFDMAKDIHICDCESIEDTDFPVLKMNIGSEDKNRWFEYHSRFYAKFISGRCQILIKIEHSDYFSDMWLMGAAFLREYYSIHDVYNQKLALIQVAETTRIMSESDLQYAKCDKSEQDDSTNNARHTDCSSLDSCYNFDIYKYDNSLCQNPYESCGQI